MYYRDFIMWPRKEYRQQMFLNDNIMKLSNVKFLFYGTRIPWRKKWNKIGLSSVFFSFVLNCFLHSFFVFILPSFFHLNIFNFLRLFFFIRNRKGFKMCPIQFFLFLRKIIEKQRNIVSIFINQQHIVKLLISF